MSVVSRGRALLVVLSLLVSGCAGGGPGAVAPAPSPPPTGRADPSTPKALVALADGTLLAVSTVDGSVLARGNAAAPARSVPGQVIAVAPAGGPVYLLTGDGVAVVDRGTLAVRGTYRLRSGVRYSSLVVGAATGRLYVAGDGRLTVLDPAGGMLGPDRGRAVADTGVARPADWFVQAAAVSPDERYAVLSYHGETTGADIVPLAGPDPVGCDRRRDPQRDGCVPEVHGLVAASANGIVAATGGEEIVAVGYDGTLRHRWEHGLPGNHLMEFAVVGEALVALGPCDYSGGLSRIDTGNGAVRVLVPARAGTAPSAGSVCGDRVAAVPDGPLVVVDGRRLWLVDPATGAVRQTVDLPADALDVLAA